MIDIKKINQIAKLARLEISASEAIEYSQQLSKALVYFELISQVDTSEVEPLVTPVEVDNVWRKDLVEYNFSAQEMLANAPQKVGNLFKVPPVV